MTPSVQGQPVRQQRIQLKGGLDVVSPALETNPGTCIDASNFVPDLNGGYKRVGGYERLDGRPSPSDAAYSIVTVSGLGSVSLLDQIVGSTSAATAVVVAVPGNGTLVVTKVAGTFVTAETLTVSAAAVGTVSAFVTADAPNSALDAAYKAAAADVYRSDIGPVPGSGPVRGVHLYDGVWYAWRDNAGATALVMHEATSSGWTAVAGVPALLPGGHVRCMEHNFSGAAAGKKLFGADGINPAFQWDGTTYTQIATTAVPDTPSVVVAHKNRLFAAILGSLFLSGPGDPVSSWVGVGSTPAEIGTGDTITDLVPLPAAGGDGALAVYGRNKTSILYGSSTSTWQMSVVSPDTGSVAATAQFVGTALALDDRGVTSLSATQDYGNFSASTISKLVQPLIAKRAGHAACSLIVRSQNQYRVMFDDGFGLVFRMEGGRSVGAMPIQYPDAPSCAYSGENQAGVEVVAFGAEEGGYVYQADIGTSFDGEAIDSWIRLAFNDVGDPGSKKRWVRARVDVGVTDYTEISFAYEHDYGNEDIAGGVVAPFGVRGRGGFWDGFDWDNFYWDSPFMAPPVFRLNGSSTNLSCVFYSNSAISSSFTLQGVLIQYKQGRLDRRMSA